MSDELDQRFEQILLKIKPYLLDLSSTIESRRCRLWLERLNRADDQKGLRNEYLGELYKQLKNGRLIEPFHKPPGPGRLVPLYTLYPLPTSSSYNELTETSVSFSDGKHVWNRPRSKSLRRDVQSPKNRYFDVHSSSPVCSSRIDNPNVHFYDQDNRNILRAYQERIENLSAIVQKLENVNEKLKKELNYYRNEEVPQCHKKIKILMAKIGNLKRQLVEVLEMKRCVEKNHKEIIEQYKIRFTEQFNTMKRHLETERKENQELSSKIVKIEQKFQELTKENEESVKVHEESWFNKLTSVKSEYETILQEKDLVIKSKDDALQKKDLELASKHDEIDNLRKKVKNLQDLVNLKFDDDEIFRTQLIDQYKAIRQEMSKLSKNFGITSRTHKNFSTKDLLQYNDFVEKLDYEYDKINDHVFKEKTRKINSLKKCISDKGVVNMASLKLLLKQREIDGNLDDFNDKYKELLNIVESTAVDKRCKYSEKLSFLEDQLHRLQKD